MRVGGPIQGASPLTKQAAVLLCPPPPSTTPMAERGAEAPLTASFSNGAAAGGHAALKLDADLETRAAGGRPCCFDGSATQGHVQARVLPDGRLCALCSVLCALCDVGPNAVKRPEPDEFHPHRRQERMRTVQAALRHES